MMRRSGFVASLLLLSSVSWAAPDKKTLGQVAVAGGLLKVHTFCLAEGALATRQAGDVEKFVARAGTSKGVFTNLNWKLVSNCSDALGGTLPGAAGSVSQVKKNCPSARRSNVQSVEGTSPKEDVP